MQFTLSSIIIFLYKFSLVLFVINDRIKNVKKLLKTAKELEFKTACDAFSARLASTLVSQQTVNNPSKKRTQNRRGSNVSSEINYGLRLKVNLAKFVTANLPLSGWD